MVDVASLSYLPEAADFPEQIPQLEDGFWPTGGPVDPANDSGIMNWHALLLANRTRHLKNELAALQAAFDGQDIGALISAATADMLTEAQGDGRYLLQSAFTGAALLNLIKPVDGAGSGLDADKLDGLHASAFARTDENTTLLGMLISERVGHEKIRLVGAPGENPYYSIWGAEGARGVFQAYDDHIALRVYKPDGGLISLRLYDDGRITWNGKKLLTEEDKTPDRVDEFAPFPAANASVSVLHGYGQAPTSVQAWAVCVNASGGYAPGDRICLGSHYRYHVGGMAFGANATEILFSAKYLDIITASGGGIVGLGGSADWKLELQSWM